jgi:chorismate synthase
MAGNTIGTLFRVTTFGESHGEAIGVVIDGCPAGLELDLKFIQSELARRRPGQSALTTQRQEEDQVHWIAGIFEGKTTGMPLAALIFNQDARSKDYDSIKDVYRPSHADFTWQARYGHRDHRGGGRSSARETACRVIAGAVAKLLLKSAGIQIQAYVSQVGHLRLEHRPKVKDLQNSEKNPVRCPDPNLAKQMGALIQKVRSEGDTIGGVVDCCVQGVPAGLGEPVFDRLHADLGKAMLSINAAKGFEIGSGFQGSTLRGSQHNDPFVVRKGQVQTTKNDSGGVQGGISNGMEISFRVAFKPVATLMLPQRSISKKLRPAEVRGRGRHDPCVVPRAVVIVEAMAALTLADHWLRARTARLNPGGSRR